MTQVFLDLMQTPQVTLPIGIGLALIIFVVLLFRTRPDKNDYTLEEFRAAQEAKQQARIEEAQLMSLYASDEVGPPQQRMDDLNRGADIPSRDENTTKVTNTPYSDMAAKYGFETYKHYGNNEMILFDTELPHLDVDKRIYVLLLPKVLQASERQLRLRMGNGRSTINRRALRAGLEPVKRRAGRPARAGVSQ